jgi:MFS family permease
MDDVERARSRRAIAAAIAGNVLEWYDFVVYSYFATILAKTLFPPGDEAAALLDTFAAFGIGFIARPVGAIVIGWLGDRRGRKAALVLTMAMMAGGTVLLGLVPSYATIGALAPAILVSPGSRRDSRPGANGEIRPRSWSSGHRKVGAASTAASSNAAWSRAYCSVPALPRCSTACSRPTQWNAGAGASRS